MAKATTKGRHTIRRLAVGSGSWSPLGHSQSPPSLAEVAAVLGLPRFTDEDQAANPSRPMTRIVKDVLSVGRKSLAPGEAWDVTVQTLTDIAKNYTRGQSLGYAANLGKTHGDPETGLIHPDDLIQPIDQAVVVGDTLWISAYVTPEQCDYLCNNHARKVSIATLEPFEDGSGNKYPIQLVHVAVTDQPVDVGQGRFSKLTRSLAKGLTMDFEALKTAVNSLLSALGLPALGDDITDANITDRLSGIAHALGASAPAPKPEGEETLEMEAMPELDPAMMAKSPMIQKALSLAITPMVAGLKAELETLKTEKVETAKARYLAKTAEFGKAGMLGKRVDALNAQGAKYGYDMALLEGREYEKGVDMRKLSKSLATANAPEVPVETNGKASDEEVEARLLARGIKPNWKPQHKAAK